MNILTECWVIPRGLEIGDHVESLVCRAHTDASVTVVDDVSGMTLAELTQAAMNHEKAEHPPTHGFKTIVREVDGSYTALCQCGEHFTGYNSSTEPDIDERKDHAYALLADHAVALWREQGIRL